jgi:hypothetical protein
MQVQNKIAFVWQTDVAFRHPLPYNSAPELFCTAHGMLATCGMACPGNPMRMSKMNAVRAKS